MEKRAQPKKTRKIRNTEDFNEEQNSLARENVRFTKKKVAKRTKSFLYLPQINLDNHKENVSPNMNEEIPSKDTGRKFKKISKDFHHHKEQNVDLKDIKSTDFDSLTYQKLLTKEDRRDSKVVNKKKRKKKQSQLKLKTESISDTNYEKNIIECEKEKTNHTWSVTVNEEGERKICSKKKLQSAHSSNSFALTPVDSDDLSDEVFTNEDDFYDTLEICSFTNRNSSSLNRKNSEPQNSTFEVSNPHVVNTVEFVETNHINGHDQDKKSQISRAAQCKLRRSKSMSDSDEASKRKSVRLDILDSNVNCLSTKCALKHFSNETSNLSHGLVRNSVASGTPDDVDKWRFLCAVENSTFDTLEIRHIANRNGSSLNRKNSEIQNSTFEVSNPHVVNTEEFVEINHINGHEQDKKSCRSRAVQCKLRRSKSMSDSYEASENKSVRLDTLDSNVNCLSTRHSALKSFSNKTSNLSHGFAKKSVAFGTPDQINKCIFLCEVESSKSYPKSPHVTKLSKSVGNKDIIDHEEGPESAGIRDQKCTLKHYRKFSNLNKLSNNSFKVSKKSASFLTPKNYFNKVSKTSYRKSPFVHRNTLNASESGDSSTDFNETFETQSPTLSECTNSKNNLALSSTTPDKSRSKKMNLLEISSVNLITPSPYAKNRPSKKSTGNYYRVDNFSNDKSDSTLESKSDPEMRITKRKKWNKSVDMSIFNHSIMQNTLPSWKEALHSSEGVRQHSFFSTTNSSNKWSDLNPKKELTPVKSSQYKLKSTSIESGNYLNNCLSPVKTLSSKILVCKEKSKATSQSKSGSQKRTKLPNFALIHKRAYDKLENVKDMRDRKAARAQQLLSGKKPGPETSLKAPPSHLKIKSPTLKIKSPKSRKLLRYSPRKRASLEKIKKFVPQPTTSKSVVVESEIENYITPSKSNPKAAITQPKVTKSRIPKFVNAKKKVFPKLAGADSNENLSRQEKFKATINKTRGNTNTLESRRMIFRNVRSNRNFELLMKMRNNNNS